MTEIGEKMITTESEGAPELVALCDLVIITGEDFLARKGQLLVL